MERIIERLAPVLNCIKPDPNARVGYELMSDALIWSDEMPPPEERVVEESNWMRGIFRFRTTLILGQPDERIRPKWDEAMARFPLWPGFLPERRTESVELRRLYEERSAKLLSEWEELDVRYERQRAAATTPRAAV